MTVQRVIHVRWQTFGRFVAYSLLALMIVTGATAGAIASARRPPDFASLQREGDRIVAQIEEYNRKYGEYPADADTAELALPMTRFGKWEYQRFERGAADAAQWYWVRLSTKVPFELMRPYFTLGWSSERPSWRVSTDPC